MKITLVYDNEVHQKGLQGDWGFSCLVEMGNTPGILFDTGANGEILLGNMKKLDIDPGSIAEVVISHDHWDHTGGLSGFLEANKTAKVYLPGSVSGDFGAQDVIRVKEPLQIQENVFSTGELKGIEQSLVVRTEKGLVVIAGCSHSGVGNILQAAREWGEVHALIGGLHGFREFDLLSDLELVCACHCTQFQSEIKSLYPEKWIDGGAGRVISI